MPFHVTEPHPSVPSSKKSTYIQSGRGGAGNYARYSASTLSAGPSATGPASRAPLPPPPTTAKFTSGRGGAGNLHSQRAIFSFDEELERDQRLIDNAARTPVYHIGIGGAGNAVDEMKPKNRTGSGGSIFSNASDSSGDSATSEAKKRPNLARTFTKLSTLSRAFSHN